MTHTGEYEIVELGMLKGKKIVLLNLTDLNKAFYGIAREDKFGVDLEDFKLLFERKGDLIDDLKKLIEKEKDYGF